MTTVIWLDRETAEANPLREKLADALVDFGEKTKGSPGGWIGTTLLRDSSLIQFAIKHGYRYAIAVKGKKILGVSCVRPKGFGSNRLISQFILVDPSHEREGIGSMIHRKVAAFARREGYSIVEDTVTTIAGKNLVNKWIQKQNRKNTPGKKIIHHKLQGGTLHTYVQGKKRPWHRQLVHSGKIFLNRFRIRR